MGRRTRRGVSWYAVAAAELAAMGVLCALSRSAPLIGDVHDEDDDERAEVERHAARIRRRTMRDREHFEPIGYLAQ